ncbi:MAG: efflux transporter outer membrane subunit [Pseudomonadota bacterium]
MLKRSAAVAVLAMCGCQSVDQEYLAAQLPEPPKEWTSIAQLEAAEPSSGVPTGDWIAAFEDEQLKSLIDEAMAHNNTLLATAANLEGARQGARIAFAGQLPTLDANPRASRNAIVLDPTFAAQAGGGAGGIGDVRIQDLEDQFGVDLDGDGELDALDTDGVLDGQGDIQPIPNRRFYINNYSLGAQFQWEIDLWGRLHDQTKAARRDAAASLADFEAARLSIAAAVAQGWFTLVEARQQRELAERDVEAREKNLRVTRRRYERGVSSSLDVRLAQSALGTSRATLAQRQQVEKESGRRVEVLLGRYPAAEVQAAAELPTLPRLNGAGAPGEILARRPDLFAAEMRMEAAGLRARVARKEMLPRFTLTASLNTSGPDLEDVIDPERLAGNIAGGMLTPLFRGGALKARSQQARAQAQASLLNYVQTALEAYEEAENALGAESFLALQEEALKLAFDEAAAAETLTERRYAQGAASIFDLLNAQTRRISNESAYITVKRQRVANRVALYLAIGGDFIAEPTIFDEEAVTASGQNWSGRKGDEATLVKAAYDAADGE